MSLLRNWPRPTRLPWLLLISAAAIVLDRITKVWVAAHVPYGTAIPVIDRVLGISHWNNDGAAFSLFASSASPQTVRWMLVLFASLAALVVLVLMIRLGNRIGITTTALALVLGGAIGNIYDRVAYGSVIDFIEVHIVNYHYPDFNVADSCVVVGACLLVLDSLMPQRDGQS